MGELLASQDVDVPRARAYKDAKSWPSMCSAKSVASAIQRETVPTALSKGSGSDRSPSSGRAAEDCS